MEEYNVTELLDNFSFGELNQEERNWIETKMGKDSYEAQREILLKAKKGYENELKSIPINTDLLEEIKQENSRKRALFPIWLSKPVPSYVFGLAALAFFFLYFSKPTKTNELIVYRESPKEIVTDTIFIKDTVYSEIQELPNPQKRIKLASNSKKKKKKQPEVNNVTYTFEEQYFDAEQLQEQQNLVGSSVESSELGRFLGVQI